jgi:hypothetical protein
MAEPLEFQMDVQIKKLTQSLAQAEARVNKTATRLDADFRRTNARVSTGVAQSAAGFARLGQVTGAQRFVLQNTANQLGDIAVQLETGASASRVFGQQLPQILGGFGALGGTLGLVAPLLGTVAALGIPLAAMFLKTGKDAEEAAPKIKTFQERLSDATAALGRAEDALRLAAAGAAVDVAARYHTLNAEIQKLVGSLAELEVFGARQQGDELISGILPGLTASKEQLQLATVEYDKQLARLGEIFGLQQGVATMDQSRFDALERERIAIEAQLRASEGLRDELSKIGDALNLLPEEAARFAGHIIDAQEAMKRGDFEAAADALRAAQDYARSLGFTIEDEIVRNLIQAEDFTRQTAARMGDVQIAADGVVSSTAGIVANISSAANQAARLAGNLAESAKNINFDASDLAPATSPRPRPAPALIGEGGAVASAGGGRGGGGGGGVNPLVAQLETIRRSLMTQEQVELESFGKQQEQLQAALEQKLLTQQEYNALMEDAQRQHQQKMSNLERTQQNQRLSAYAGALGDLSSLMETNNKKLFAIGKAAAIAEATVSGYQAAVEAWQKGMEIGGPPVAAAFAAASIAKTGALISKLASSSIGGAGGNSDTGGGTVAPTQAGTYLNFTFTGGYSTPEQMGRFMVASLNSAIENGAVIRGARIV